MLLQWLRGSHSSRDETLGGSEDSDPESSTETFVSSSSSFRDPILKPTVATDGFCTHAHVCVSVCVSERYSLSAITNL